MANNLSFNIAALDNASKTFLRVAQQVERLADKLERLDRQRVNVQVDVDTSRATRQTDETKRKLDTLASGFSGSIIKAVAFGEALSKLALPPTLLASAGALGPVLAGLAVTAAQVSGALLLLPAAGAAGATAFGALTVATMGVGDALKAMMAVDQGAAGASQARANALRAVENAQRNLESTIVHGVERIADAERAVTRAQENARDAQEDLNRAREEAAERLRDLQLQLADASLSEEEAVLAVAEANQRLNEVAARGGDALDMQRAQLGLKRAELTLTQVRDRYQDLQAEAAKATRAGVEGDERVQRAHARVEDATESIADAQRALARTQRDVAEAQLDALAQLQQAQESLGAGGGVDKFAQAMAGLSTEAKAFVLAIQAVRPAFDDMRLDVQDKLFAGLGDKVQALARVYLPILGSAFEAVAGSANRTLHGLGDLLLQRSADFDQLGQASAGVFDDLSQAVVPLLAALTDIAVVGGDVLKELTAGAGGVAQEFADFIHEARESGQLEKWIRSGLDALAAFGHLLADIGGILSGLFKAASDGATGVLGPMGSLLDATHDWVNSVQGQEDLRKFFDAGTRVVKAFLPVLEQVADILGTVVAPAMADLSEAAAPGLAVFVRALGEGLRALSRPGQDGASAMEKFGEAIGAVGEALAPVLPVLGEALADALITISPELDDLALALADVLVALAPYVPELAKVAVTLAEVLVPALENAAEAIAYLEPVISVIVGALGWFGGNLETGLRTVNTFAHGSIDAFRRFDSVTRGAFASVGDAAHDGVWTVVGYLDWLVGWVSGVPSRMWNATRGMFNGIWDAFHGAINGIIDKWNSLTFSLPGVDIPGIGQVGGFSISTWPKIPPLDVGGEILRTGLALVHRGERVVPAAKVAPLGNGGAVRVEIALRSDASNNQVADAIIRTLQPVVRSRGGVKVVFA